MNGHYWFDDELLMMVERGRGVRGWQKKRAVTCQDASAAPKA